MDEFDRKYDTMIRTTWFNNHVASLHQALIQPNTLGEEPSRESMQFLKWKNPKNGAYAVYYVIYGPNLMVFGDLDSAVYRWSEDISFEFLSGCHYTYFAKKCEANEIGNRGRQWFEERCQQMLQERLNYKAQRLLESGEANKIIGDEYEEWDNLTKEQQDKLIDYYIFKTVIDMDSYYSSRPNLDFSHCHHEIERIKEELNESCVSQFTWAQRMEDYPEIFTYEDDFYDWGYDVSTACRAHLIGIQMAMEQVKQQEAQAETQEKASHPITLIKPPLFVFFKWILRLLGMIKK